MKNIVRLLIVVVLAIAAVVVMHANRQAAAAKTAYDQLDSGARPNGLQFTDRPGRPRETRARTGYGCPTFERREDRDLRLVQPGPQSYR